MFFQSTVFGPEHGKGNGLEPSLFSLLKNALKGTGDPCLLPGGLLIQIMDYGEKSIRPAPFDQNTAGDFRACFNQSGHQTDRMFMDFVNDRFGTQNQKSVFFQSNSLYWKRGSVFV